MEIHEIVLKLVGYINPAGDSGIDNKRFENLKVLTDLVSDLLADIDYVSRYKDSYENSVRVMGQYAENFLKDLYNEQ